jgi:hypothetical protein
MHTVMDRTSPAHEGNQPWHGMEGVGNKLRALHHVNKEVYAQDAQRAIAVQRMRAAYFQASGSELYKQAVPPKKGSKITYYYDGSPIED